MNKTILYIASLDSIHSLKWINFFLNLNYKVAVLSTTEKIKSFEFSKEPELFIYNKFKNKYLNVLVLIIDIIFKRRICFSYDIIHVHYIGLNAFIAMFLKINNLILTAWGSDIKINKNNVFKRFFLKQILKKSKFITTDSNEIKNLISRINVSLLDKIKIINFGINTNFFSKKEYSFEIAKKLNLENCQNHLKIISLRNHFKVYDIQTLIYSISDFTKFNKKIKCYIYGNGPETENLKKLVVDLKLESKINFMGKYQQDELPYLFSVFDCYVSTSLSDAGISASTAEAMSCQLCPISTNNSENNLWIEHKKTGFLFENGNVEQLVQIFKNLSNFDLTKIGRESRNVILKKNDYQSEMKKVKKIYEELSE